MPGLGFEKWNPNSGIQDIYSPQVIIKTSDKYVFIPSLIVLNM
jgi:hypothetical protein